MAENDRKVSFCAGVPAFNEEASIGGLLESLTADKSIPRIVVADDMSSDGTPQIVEEFAKKDPRVSLLRAKTRGGQVARWLDIARNTNFDVIVYMDADSRPAPGAVARLASSCDDGGLASGRIQPMTVKGARAGRVSATILHEIRRGPHVAPKMIGRFFAVPREWFLQNCDRTDIIANDAYVGCLAARDNRAVHYIADAGIFYIPPTDGKDFAAQRQRADAGFKQLKEIGLLKPSYVPGMWTVGRAIVSAAMQHPSDIAAWVYSQILSRLNEHYRRPSNGHAGMWESQTSTKTGRYS